MQWMLMPQVYRITESAKIKNPSGPSVLHRTEYEGMKLD